MHTRITFWTKTPFFKSKQYVPDILVDVNSSEVARQYGYDVEIVHLPGHTKGSYGILKDGVLYAGDLNDSAKGFGLGYELIEFIEGKMRRAGYKQSYLETHDNLQAAIHIY